MNSSAQKRSVFGADRLKPQVKSFAKPVRWSHQKELANMIAKPIVLLTSEGQLNGMLLDADQFTLRVRVKVSDDKEQTFTFFKHALHGYGLA